MDVLAGILFFCIPFFLFCLCSYCCRSKQRGIIFSTFDFPWGFVIFIIIVILFSMCTHCCRDERGVVYRTFEFFPWGFMIFIIIVILFSMCAQSCCDDRTTPRYRTPVVVTSATHTAPGGYPNAVRTTTVYPTSTSGYQQTAYPQQAPYPVAGAPMAMPMPMQNAQMSPNPIGINAQAMPPYPPNAAPYPPTAAPYPPTGPVAPYPPAANFSGNPPSYDSAVGVHQPSAGYEKQMPYNPGYMAQY